MADQAQPSFADVEMVARHVRQPQPLHLGRYCIKDDWGCIYH